MEEILKKRVVAVVAVIVLLVGASVASIIYMKSGKNDGSKTAYIYRDNELLRTFSLDDVKNPYTFRIEYGDGEYNDIGPPCLIKRQRRRWMLPSLRCSIQ